MGEQEKSTLSAIHKAATDEFLEKGFKTESLRKIVKTAGVTTGAFSGSDNWDFSLLELGVNMLDHFSVEEFDERCTYFIEKMAQTKKTLIIVTIYPNRNKYSIEKDAYKKNRCVQ